MNDFKHIFLPHIERLWKSDGDGVKLNASQKVKSTALQQVDFP